jgi:hypothetical protein
MEFFNRSVVRAVHRRGQFEWTPSTFPKTYLDFDPRTGRASASPTRYVAQSDKETRFRIAGTAISDTRDMLLIDAGQPWRSDWLSFDLYDDGWTLPGVPAKVRVYATPGQRGPVTRSLSLGIRGPADVAKRRVDVASDAERWRDTATNGATLLRPVKVCVPPKGYATVRIATPSSSPVYGDMRDLNAAGRHREGGVLLVQIALADEIGGPC